MILQQIYKRFLCSFTKDQNKDDVHQCVRHITRYTDRPVIVDKRIVEYDNINIIIY